MYVFGGRYKGENMSNYFSRFKMASCPFEAWWLFDPKPDRDLLLWSQKWKENMLQNIRLQRNRRRSPRSDNNMNDSCVNIYLYLEGREREISFTLADFLSHPRPRKFRNVQCFECKLRTMSYYGASRDLWKQRFGAASAMDIFGRRRIDRPQKKAVSLCWNERFIIWRW